MKRSIYESRKKEGKIKNEQELVTYQTWELDITKSVYFKRHCHNIEAANESFKKVAKDALKRARILNSGNEPIIKESSFQVWAKFGSFRRIYIKYVNSGFDLKYRPEIIKRRMYKGFKLRNIKAVEFKGEEFKEYTKNHGVSIRDVKNVTPPVIAPKTNKINL